VVSIEAPPTLLAERLAGRGREDPEAIARRLDRAVPLPAGPDVVRLVNDGPVAAGVDALVRILRAR
jgi:ribose 1,5-bisphosphokinase PhnN